MLPGIATVTAIRQHISIWREQHPVIVSRALAGRGFQQPAEIEAETRLAFGGFDRDGNQLLPVQLSCGLVYVTISTLGMSYSYTPVAYTPVATVYPKMPFTSNHN